MIGMLHIKKDIEIQNIDQDKLRIEQDIDDFIDDYIFSDYKGSVLLNGKWGIGKSSFLNLIEKEVNSRKNKKDKIEFIWLNAWKRSNSESFYSDIYAKIHKKRHIWLEYYPLFIAIILSVAVAIIQFFPFFFKSNKQSITISMLLIWLSLFIINSALNYFKDTYDLESVCRKKVQKIIKKRKIIFIVDDFDRVEKQQRKLLYQYMSDLNSFNNSIIIVVGEYKKIVEDPNDIFTQKILQNIENMPEQFDSYNVWSIFENDLQDIIKSLEITYTDKFIINNIRSQFIKENRTMREYILLYNSFKRTFKSKEKSNVNFSELLALCYIFTFYNHIYEVINNKIEDVICRNPSEEKNKKDSLKEKLKDNNINDENNIIDFIFRIFNHGYAASMKYPSITNPGDYRLYKLKSKANTKINDNFIEEYIEKNEYEGLKLLDKLEVEEYKRFFNMFKYKVIEEQILISTEDYLREMIKLVYYKFYGDHRVSGISNITTAYVDELLDDLSNRLEMHLSTDKVRQCKKIALSNNDLDLSQKILVIEFIIRDIETLYVEKKQEMIANLFEQINFVDIKKAAYPNIVYWSYTKYYNRLYKETYNDILSEIFYIDDEEFVDIIEKKFIKSIKSENSKGEKRERKELHLKEISFSQDFEDKFIEKIRQLEPNKRNEILKIIV